MQAICIACLYYIHTATHTAANTATHAATRAATHTATHTAAHAATHTATHTNMKDAGNMYCLCVLNTHFNTYCNTHK